VSRRRSDRPTLADVASLAGVSVPAASQALSGNGRISVEVRTRVVEAAGKLGYRPPRRESGITAVLTMMGHAWAYTWGMNQRVIDSFALALRAAGREPVLVPVQAGESESAVVRRVRSLNADSVVTVHYGNEGVLGRLEALGLPVVVIMNGNLQDQFTSVCADDYRGGYEAGRVLLDAGHRSVAYISADLPQVTAVRTDRLVGIRQSLQEAGGELHGSYQPVIPLSDQEQATRIVRDLISGTLAPNTPPPTAIYVMDDYLGLRVLRALERCGVAVPQDMSVLAAGDVLDYHEPHVPRLSTMSIQFEAMGRSAAELLQAAPRGGWSGRAHEVLKVRQHYVDRGSVQATSI